MLTRILLIVAILAALAAGALSFTQVRSKITQLMQQRDDYHNQLTQTQATLETTRKDLTKTKADLTQTQQDLATAKKAEATAESNEAAQKKRADDLNDKLAKASSDRDKAQADLAAYVDASGGLSPKQVAELGHSLKNAQTAISALNEEKLVMGRTIDRLRSQLAELIGTNTVVTLPPNLRGKILVVDPKWDFVVVSVGDDQGVKPDGELLVSRDGRLVAKVIVRSIQKDRSIANVVPGWKLGQVIEGDDVTPAHPSS